MAGHHPHRPGSTPRVNLRPRAGQDRRNLHQELVMPANSPWMRIHPRHRTHRGHRHRDPRRQRPRRRRRGREPRSGDRLGRRRRQHHHRRPGLPDPSRHRAVRAESRRTQGISCPDRRVPCAAPSTVRPDRRALNETPSTPRPHRRALNCAPSPPRPGSPSRAARVVGTLYPRPQGPLPVGNLAANVDHQARNPRRAPAPGRPSAREPERSRHAAWVPPSP